MPLGKLIKVQGWKYNCDQFMTTNTAPDSSLLNLKVCLESIYQSQSSGFYGNATHQNKVVSRA